MIYIANSEVRLWPTQMDADGECDQKPSKADVEKFILENYSCRALNIEIWKDPGDQHWCWTCDLKK